MANKLTGASPVESNKSGKPDKWECEDAIRTLTRAEEIKKDARLMSHVRKHAVEQQKTLAKVVGKAAPSKGRR